MRLPPGYGWFCIANGRLIVNCLRCGAVALSFPEFRHVPGCELEPA